MFSVTIANAGVTLAVAPEGTVLAAAKEAGIAYPHGCQMGRCGRCKSRLVSGEVALLPHTRFALTDTDKGNGLILACRAQPRGDCTVEWLGEAVPAGAAAAQAVP